MSNVISFKRAEADAADQYDAADELTKLVLHNVFTLAREFNSSLNTKDHAKELVFMFEAIRSAFLAAEGRVHALQYIAQSVYEGMEEELK